MAEIINLNFEEVLLKSFGWVLLYCGTQGLIVSFFPWIQFLLVGTGTLVLMSRHEIVGLFTLYALTFVLSFLMFTSSSCYSSLLESQNENRGLVFWTQQVLYWTLQIALLILIAHSFERKLRPLSVTFTSPFLLPPLLVLFGFSTKVVLNAHTFATAVWKVGLSVNLVYQITQTTLSYMNIRDSFRLARDFEGYHFYHNNATSAHFKLFWLWIFIYGISSELLKNWSSGKPLEMQTVLLKVFCQSFNCYLSSTGTAVVTFWIYSKILKKISSIIILGTNIRYEPNSSSLFDDNFYLIFAWNFSIPDFETAHQKSIVLCFMFLVLVFLLQDATKVALSTIIDVCTYSGNLIVHLKTLGSCIFLMLCSLMLFFTLMTHERVEFTFLWLSSLAIYALIASILIFGHLMIYFCSDGDPTRGLDDSIFLLRVLYYLLFFFGDLLASAASIVNIFRPELKLSTYLMVPAIFFVTFKRLEKLYSHTIKRLKVCCRMKDLCFAKSHEILAYNDICAICYSILERNAIFTICGHLFHTTCLRKWMEYQGICPICKTETRINDEALDHFSGYSDEEEIFIPESDLQSGKEHQTKQDEK